MEIPSVKPLQAKMTSVKGPAICELCLDNFIVNNKLIECKNCVKKFHVNCAQVKDKVSKILAECKNLLWFCNDCIANVQEKLNVGDAVEKLNEKTNILTETTTKLLNIIENTSSLPSVKSYSDIVKTNEHNLRHTNKITNNFPSVIIKPRKNQDPMVTKNVIFQKINPAELNIGVNNVKVTKTGNIAIKCSTKEDTEKFKNLAVEKLKNAYEVEETKLRRPRIKIMSHNNDKNEEELEQLIKSQNKYIDDDDEIRITYIKKTKTIGSIIFAECSPNLFNKIMDNKKLYIGWERCPAYEDISVPQCFNCSGFYHKNTNCKNKTICAFCGGEHSKSECQKRIKKCSNCENANQKYKTEYPVNHEADSKECPSYKYHLQILKNKIDYGQQIYG